MKAALLRFRDDTGSFGAGTWTRRICPATPGTKGGTPQLQSFDPAQFAVSEQRLHIVGGPLLIRVPQTFSRSETFRYRAS